MPRAIHQIMGTCSYGDAIGNMAFEHLNTFREAGFKSEIFAERIHPDLTEKARTLAEYEKFRKNDDILIYHLSIGSAASEFVYGLDKKILLYYHNITPHHFFKGFHDVLWLKCALGREELKSFIPKTEFALADSEFNRKELISAGFERTAMLPVPVDFSRVTKLRSPLVEKMYDDDRTNILYVGRIIPNKKIEDVIYSFHQYRKTYNKNARLLLVGSYTSFETYMYWLWDIVRGLGETENVVFTGHISDEDLGEYYNLGELFLMMSEHEGFGVPLLEAFAAKIPVIAYDAGAAGETMRGGGLLISGKNHELTAGLMNNLLTNDKYRQQVIMGQDEAMKEYRKTLKTNDILSILRENVL